jgi:hypothetical protein
MNPVDYISYARGNLKVDFTAASVALGRPNIMLPFGSGVGGSRDDKTETFEAVVYDDSACRGTIVAKTPGAKLPQQHIDKVPSPEAENYLKVHFDTVNRSAPVLKIVVPVSTLAKSPFFTPCADTAGDEMVQCGRLNFCVTAQAIASNVSLIDFVDVNVATMILFSAANDERTGG